jgi:hypothetical protein
VPIGGKGEKARLLLPELAQFLNEQQCEDLKLTETTVKYISLYDNNIKFLLRCQVFSFTNFEIQLVCAKLPEVGNGRGVRIEAFLPLTGRLLSGRLYYQVDPVVGLERQITQRHDF